MTKIWCTICNKSDFGVNHPTQQQVLEHARDTHKPTVIINSADDQKRWRQHQNHQWNQRRTELEEQLEALQQQLEKHMDVYDDGEDEEQTVDEETTEDEEPTPNITAAAERLLAVMESQPSGGTDNSEDEEESPANGVGQETTTVDEEPTPEDIAAALTLVSMRESRPSAGLSTSPDQLARYTEQELEAARALEMLRRGEATSDPPAADTEQTTAGDGDEVSERSSTEAVSVPLAKGTEDDPLVIPSDHDASDCDADDEIDGETAF